jgi:UDP-N-acetylglucosamine 3-dehydrogenase
LHQKISLKKGVTMRIAVIGAGVMGTNHIRSLSKFREVTEILVADNNFAAISALKEKDFEKAHYFNSFQEIMKQNKPDAAIIVVPTTAHYVVGTEVIGFGIPTLIEKPIAATIQDGERLVQYAKQKKTLLMIGHIERFNPAVKKLKENIHLIGKLVHFSARRFGVPTKRDVGSSFIDQAVHDIDVINYLGGKYPLAVQAIERQLLDERNPDSCTAIYEYEGFDAVVEADHVSPIKVRELLVNGEKGVAKMDYITQELSIIVGEKETTKFNSFDEIVMKVGRGTEIRPYFVKDEPLRLEHENFLKAVRGEAEPLLKPEDGIAALKAVVAGVKSAKEGKRISIS